MAYNDEDLCTNHADFAVICSFIDKFGEKLGLTLPNIGELQTLLEDTDNVSPILGQTVSQLLRRINKSVKTDRWERGLQRFAHSYSHQDGWELERFGFKKAKLECKIRVLKNLMEAQFDMYKSFKDKVNLISAKELRLQPYGRDKKGVSYWCQLDDCANLRVYCDDQDEETWTLVASSRDELVALIAELDSETPPGASREMSVDGSRSGTATPMGLSEAPTPVDSKAATPVASGRTSPILDTGQDKEIDQIDKTEEKIKPKVVEVEKIKEKLEGEKTKLVSGAGGELQDSVENEKKKEILPEAKTETICDEKKESVEEKKDKRSEAMKEEKESSEMAKPNTDKSSIKVSESLPKLEDKTAVHDEKKSTHEDSKMEVDEAVPEEQPSQKDSASDAKMDVDKKPSDSTDKNSAKPIGPEPEVGEAITEPVMLVKGDGEVKRGRGRPFGTHKKRPKGRGRPVRKAADQEAQGSDAENEEKEGEADNDGEEDEDKSPSKKRRQRGKGSTARPLPDVPRQRSARIAKIREKEEMERRELEAQRMKQLAEENRLKELKRKAREERRSDHEFSPESDVEEADAQPIKRARTAKKGMQTAFIDNWNSSAFA
ncbi:Remodeling and spacing factor 1 [Penaeus vannamei]|uniref:Remodeling and spacing factor 1 n=1 Tax=Penaeus vannamei TaxID=6689 RepID=A0A3R7N2D6_PENVA|nr:Remodeling and spacing factor 1 [Penaeus vannamei]